MTHATIRAGHVLDVLREIPAGSVHAVVTSPPYWSLRDYGLPPVVWGGDAACAHDWTLDVVLAQHGKGGNWQQANNGLGLATGTRQTRFAGSLDQARGERYAREVARGTCGRCGAWLGQFGLEPTFDLWLAHMLAVADEVARVLRPDGTFWLNLGDCYVSAPPGNARPDHSGPRLLGTRDGQKNSKIARGQIDKLAANLKPKDLVGLPWRAALALQERGWWLRQDIVWAKPNPMPESVTDRPTRAHEYVFLLSRSERYFYDGYAIREEFAEGTYKRLLQASFDRQEGGDKDYARHGDANKSRQRAAENLRLRIRQQALDTGVKDRRPAEPRPDPTLRHTARPPQLEEDPAGYALLDGRNSRSVWTIPTQPYTGAHFATFPPELARRCVLAGTSQRGCCPSCGAPWARIVEASGGTIGKGWHDHEADAEMGMRQAGEGPVAGYEGRRGTEPYRLEEKGWKPGCDCGGEPVPCTVLDPFGGSGTVAAVATGTGRRAIHVDMGFHELALERIGPLLCDAGDGNGNGRGV